MMTVQFKSAVALGVFLCCSVAVSAQKKSLADDQYFKNNFKGIVQPAPNVLYWVNNGRFVMTKEGKRVAVDAKTGAESPVAETDKKVAETPKPAAFQKNNDLFITLNGAEVQLTHTKEKEVNPTMSPDGNYVAFTRSNNLYAVNITTLKESAITTDGSETILNGYASWVYTEEILGRSSQYRSFWWSPDSKHIAFFRTDDSNVPEYTMADGNGQHGYVEKVRYPKAGDPNPAVKVGVASPDGGNIVWADFNEKDDQYFGLPYWTPDGSALWVQWMPRTQDHLKIYSVNPASGAKQVLYQETQKTWIDLDDEGSRIKFLDNGKGYLLFSDQTGWRHIYYYDMTGKLINAVTTGKYTVLDIEYVDEKNNVVYFTARGLENTARHDFYRVNLNGKNLLRLTFGDYNHGEINLSPDASYFVTTYSNVSTPAKVTLVSNKGKIIKDLGEAKAAEFDQYELAKTELLRVKSDDGLYELPMRVVWPLNMDKSKKYPVLISIYGGPNAGTCWDGWSLSGNQQWYAKEGLIQVVMDHRASGHFGKEGVNYMHRNLGYWEMKDYSTMVKWLVDNGSADPTKICITGFSYGGYMSCYALTYGADVFTHAMAGGSVTDWTYYDTHYTEKLMDTPAENPDGYKSSSVLTHVSKFKGTLQIVHGIIDDNVHLQNTINFTSKLQDAKKEFELMTYSGGRHGWPGNKWLHYTNMKTKFIYTHLLGKEMPATLRK